MIPPTRLGFLVPPGNPTVEPEMIAMAPPGCTLHFTRMNASGLTGSLTGQEDRNREQRASLDAATALLAMVRPKVIALAHTSTSYTLGKDAEATLIATIEARHNLRFITAFGAVIAALNHLSTPRIALGTPYAMETTLRGKAHLEAHGIEVVQFGILPNVVNIYDETPERARQLAHQVNHPKAQAIFLSGVGMPTIATLAALETDLGKPVLSAASAMMWHAMRTAGVQTAVPGFGQLLQG